MKSNSRRQRFAVGRRLGDLAPRIATSREGTYTVTLFQPGGKRSRCARRDLCALLPIVLCILGTLGATAPDF